MLRLRIFGISTLTVALSYLTHNDDSSIFSVAPLERLHLKSIHVITRHGARTPLNSLPNHKVEWNCCTSAFLSATLSPSTAPDSLPLGRFYRQQVIGGRAKINGNCYSGQLTDSGIVQMRELGAWLRRRYVDELALLPAATDPALIYCRSTAIQRAQESAQALLDGAFPPETRPAGWPLVIESLASHHENMYGRSECKRMRQLQQRQQQQHRDDLRPLKEQIQHQLRAALNLGADESLPSYSSLVNTFECLQLNGLPLPAGLPADTLRLLQIVGGHQSGVDFATPEICRLAIGRFVEQLHAGMAAAVGGTSAVRVYFFSGHDNTLLPLLCGLSVYDGRHPPTGSALIFEVWQADSGQHLVRLLYNRQPLLIGGAEFVPWHSFEAKMRALVPADYARECAPLDD